jgi:hypothetical protein
VGACDDNQFNCKQGLISCNDTCGYNGLDGM